MLMFRDREKPKRHRMRFLASAAAGATAAYFLDPDRGRARRAKTSDQIAAALRRGGRRVRRFGRKVGADAYGVTQKMRYQATEPKEYSDQTLAEKVKTELYGDSQVDRSKVLVNVENGVVFLRGEAQTPDQTKDLERLVLAVPGVEGVENLLHLPNEQARTKLPPREAATGPERKTG